MKSPTLMLLAAVAVSWGGSFTHNVADLPGQTLLSPESAGPTVVYLLLVAAWFTPGRRVAAWLLLGWGLLHMVGGGLLSVLPLPIWPYDPPQTLYHYSFHVLYGVMQIPLLVVLRRYLRAPVEQLSN